MTDSGWLPIRRIILLSAVLLIGWGRAGDPVYADTSVNFESPALADGTGVSSQFAPGGVTFVSGTDPSPGYLPEMRVTSRARSGTHVLQVAPDTVDSGRPALAGTLSSTHHTISMWVLNATYGSFSAPVQLRAFNSAGRRVDANGSTFVPISSTSTVSSYTQLTAASPAGDISSFLLVTDPHDPFVQGQRIWIDDLGMDAPAGSAAPDFALGSLTRTLLQVRAGGSVTALVPIHRLNGSSGPIGFSMTGLSPGVNFSFSPITTSGDSTILTLTAASAAPLTAAPITATVIARPRDSTAGSADRTIQVQVAVTDNGADARVLGMEVTQGIQTMALPLLNRTDPVPPVIYSGVRLFARSKTVLRLFANATAPMHAVPAVVLGFHATATGGVGAPLPGPAFVLADNGPRDLAVGPPTGIANADRASSTGAYNFTLPADWTNTPGNIVLRASVNPSSLSSSLTECSVCLLDNTMTLTGIHLEAAHSPINIAPVAIEFIDPRTGTGVCGHASPGAVCITPPPDTSPVFDGLRRIAPLPPDGVRIRPYEGRVVDVSAIAAHDYQDPSSTDTSAIFGTRRNDVWSQVAAFTMYNFVGGAYAIGIHSGGQAAPGFDGLWVGDFGGLEAPTLYFGLRIDGVAIVDPTRPIGGVAHETFHTQSYVHAGTACPPSFPNVSWPPDQRGDIQGVGLDLTPGSGGSPGTFRVLAPGVPPRPGLSGEYVDLMSYCSPGELNDWISVRNWNSWGDSLPNGIPLGTLAVGAPSPHMPTLHVLAMVNGDGAARILDVRSGSAGIVASAKGNTPFRIVVRDGSGKVVSTTRMVVADAHGEPDGQPEHIVTGEVPARDAASIQLVSSKGTIAVRTRSAHPPKLTLLGRLPASVGSTGMLTLRWRQTDADHDPLRASVEFSDDGGKTFRMLTNGLTSAGFSVGAATLERSNRALFRITVNDGFNDVSVETSSFKTAGSAPAVQIGSPGPGQTMYADGTLFASGQAFDDAGTFLGSTSLRWLDGRRVVGSGDQISIQGLIPGPHVLALEARDRFGRVGRRSVTVTVLDATAQLIGLLAPAGLAPTAGTLKLSTAATEPGTLALGTSACQVDLLIKSCAFPIPPGNTSGRFTLTLTAYGRTTKINLNVPTLGAKDTATPTVTTTPVTAQTPTPTPTPTRAGAGSTPTAVQTLTPTPAVTSSATGTPALTNTATGTVTPFPPAISNVNAAPNPVGYGQCNGKPASTLSWQAEVTSAGQPTVTVQYHFMSDNPKLPPSPLLKVSLAVLNGDIYGTTVDISKDASTYMQGTGGTLDFQVVAISGNLITTGADQKVQVTSCAG